MLTVKTMTENKLLIIIPIYNGKKYLPSLIESLEKSYNFWPNFSVLMINDQSTDESREIINDYKYSWLKVYDNGEKKFFVGSCNFGLEEAIRDNYNYVFLLNQDTEVTNDVFKKMCATMDQDDSIGAMQPTVLLHPQTDLLNSQGCAIHVFGLGYTLGHKTPYVKDDRLVEVAYPTGAAVMYRTKALSEVGVLARKYEMYHEDLELGWRLWLAGWRCLCLTGVSVFHKHEFSRSISRVYYMERNRWLFVLSRYSKTLLLLLIPGFIVFELAILLLSIKNSWFKQKIKTYLYFFKTDVWQFIFFERRQMKTWLKVSDRKLLRLLTPVVKYQDLGDNKIVDLGNLLISYYWRIVKKIISI